MPKNQMSRIDYKIKYEKLLKKWQHEYVKNKVLTDINTGLNKQILKLKKEIDSFSKTVDNK